MEKKAASQERREEMQNILWDRMTLRVYCDASLDAYHHLIGVAAIFLFDGSTNVYSKKLNSKVDKNIEIYAVRFALEKLPIYLKQPILANPPKAIVIYSDYNEINRFFEDRDNIKIEYLSEEKYHNPWYTAAHNAARREIYLRPKSGKWRK